MYVYKSNKYVHMAPTHTTMKRQPHHSSIMECQQAMKTNTF